MTVDLRLPEHKRQLFHHFYEHTLRYKSHPGGVYYALPAMAAANGWDLEQRLWAAVIQGNTQNPVVTSLLMAAGDRPGKLAALAAFFEERYADLAWDTDRFHHKKQLVRSLNDYLELTRAAGGQEDYWGLATEGGWSGCWDAARAIHTFGRLSSWSYLEYVRILAGGIPDSDTLMLDDFDGSRSHRNGLLLVLGAPTLMNDPTLNPGYAERPTPVLLNWLKFGAEALHQEALVRNAHQREDVTYLTFESVLCTFKSMHKPRRRYPGVYNDLLYDRIKFAESRFGRRPEFEILWAARQDALPERLRMEDNPLDPGAVAVKQNYFRETGHVVNMADDYPEYGDDWEQLVATGELARFRRWAA